MLHIVAMLIRAVVTSRVVTALVAWLGKLLTRAVARQLQIPEALVHATGLYLCARIDSFERQLLHGLLGWR